MITSYSPEKHLTVAIRNAIILFNASFFIGGVAGWGVSHWPRAPIGAGLSVIISLGFLAWYCRMYYVTKGLLHTIEKIPEQ